MICILKYRFINHFCKLPRRMAGGTVCIAVAVALILLASQSFILVWVGDVPTMPDIAIPTPSRLPSAPHRCHSATHLKHSRAALPLQSEAVTA